MKHYTKLLALLPLIVLALLTGCEKQKVQPRDFESLMGKNTDLWKHVQTGEDREQIAFYKRLFEASDHSHAINEDEIPHTIHFIWIGPKNFPKTSIQNLQSWADHHPGWHIKFWTDRKRNLGVPRIEQVMIKPSHFSHLKQFYDESDNYAERSDLLRYEILNREGGVYVDHDVVCYKSFDPIVTQQQFFCALEPPHKPIASSSISVCNNLIGAIPHHPIIMKTIDKVKNRWPTLSEMFPGKDQESIVLRVFHRTFMPFDEAVGGNMDTSTYKNKVYPAGYFNRIDGAYGLFAHHEYLGEWYKTEDPSETLMRRRLIKMSRKMNQILMISLVSVGINIALVTVFVTVMLKRRHAHE